MRTFYLTTLLLVLFTVCACNGGFEPPKEADPKELNEKISNGVQANATWIKTPESIVKELFPRRSREGENSSYSIREKGTGGEARRVTVTEEGSIDDEIKGEKIVLYFDRKGDQWEITKMNHSVKRR
ncbi:MAG TPA: hypothetical protein VJU78_11470 [Chitinophagaceae bacterium]|nr:hypothetical protein [Chitinophagaceae bacterium]